VRKWFDVTSRSDSDVPARVEVSNAEHAVLRSVATLVAAGAPAVDVLAAVVDEVAHALDVVTVILGRYDAGRAVTILASLDGTFAPGTRWPLDGPSVGAFVLETGRPARIDDYAELPGTIAAGVRKSEMRSTVAVPIAIEGETWGVMTVATHRPEPLPPDTENRLRDFTELAAIVIANAESRDRLNRLAEEQAALRRVATLVARGARSADVFEAVAVEVAKVFDTDITIVGRYDDDGALTAIGNWSASPGGVPVGTRSAIGGRNVLTIVAETGRPARLDGYSDATGEAAEIARRYGWSSSIGAPIIVDDRLWGVMLVATQRPELFPVGAEQRLAAFTDLVATAIGNAQAHDELLRFGAEQAALGRVATVVAAAAAPEHVFTTVVKEVSSLLGLEWIELVRYNPDATGTVIAASGDHPFPAGSTWSLDDPSVMATVARTRRPARVNDYSNLQGGIAEAARSASFQSAIGAPITVDGELWGVIIAISTDPAPIPERSEARLGQFTELLATAVANTQSREQVAALADEQAALRRVATLVAQGTESQLVFDAVCAETGPLLGASVINLSHYTKDGFNVTMAGWSQNGMHVPVGTRFPTAPDTIGGAISRTRAPVRVDSWEDATSELAKFVRDRGIRSSLGAPIMVDGQLWGALVAATDRDEQLAAGTEFRLARFTELIATAVANTQSREQVAALADEQAALRRVATLVAEGANADELFSGVVREVAGVLGVANAVLDRFEPDGDSVLLAYSHDPSWVEAAAMLEVGGRWPAEAGTLTAAVHETGRAARVDDYADVFGVVGDRMRLAGVGSGCAAPIFVDGALWGAIRVFTRAGVSLPPEAESRLYGFSELVGTAVSNADARTELIASRARIVAAGDEARRRIERNLHDGTQQRLISIGLDLQRIKSSIAPAADGVRADLNRVNDDLETVLEDVRELSRGLHAPELSRLGLRVALFGLARRSPIAVELEIDLDERPAEAIETAVYYVVAEALTNATKYSNAQSISVTISTQLERGRLHATVVDDGVGGAEAVVGTGLVGLSDRVEALGGRFTLHSPPGEGTRISVLLPLTPPQ
jgi:GAF domain-containing protein